jgi:hypothetical protein
MANQDVEMKVRIEFEGQGEKSDGIKLNDSSADFLARLFAPLVLEWEKDDGREGV